MDNEATYVCDACGEDCPVCCRANVIHVEIEGGSEAKVWAEREQG